MEFRLTVDESMDALINYGSDDESSDKYLENKGLRIEEMKSTGRLQTASVEDVNYDNVQMDMSEESDAGQRPKGTDAGRSSSASSFHSSSTEDDEPPHVKPRVPASSSHYGGKRAKESRERDGGYYGGNRHKKKDERRRSPGQKESSRHKKKDRRRSRSKDRSGKLRESKEKERDKKRRGNSRDRGGIHDSESSSKDVSRRKSGREGSCKRSRSHDKARYGHHSDRRRSRSRSPHHHHRHHHGHHDESDRRSKRSRGRSPSKTNSGDESRSAEAKKANAVSRAVAAAAANIAAAVAATEAAQSSSASSSSSSKNEGGSISNNELGEEGNQSVNTKSSQQALLEGLGLQVEGNLSRAAVTGLSASLVTPQLLVQRSLEVQASHVHNTTGIQFPAYYNPAAMNPLKYAEQMQKRKKLWGGNKDNTKEPSATGGTSGSTNNWESTTFAQDQDGKLSAKFKRLMGIKTPGAVTTSVSTQPDGAVQSSDDVIKKQEELFSTMERQYEAARLATHTLRGVGLGFGSSSAYQYPR